MKITRLFLHGWHDVTSVAVKQIQLMQDSTRVMFGLALAYQQNIS